MVSRYLKYAVVFTVGVGLGFYAYIHMTQPPTQDLTVGGPVEVGPIDPWVSTTTPVSSVTQRVWGRAIKLTGLTTGQCLTLTAGSILSTVACSAASTGAVATSSNEVSGQLAFFTSNSGTPALIAGDTGLSFNSTADRLTVTYASSTGITAGKFFGALVGNADTATALAGNGTNASAGNAILGVDASGNAEGAFDVWTEAENTAAAYAAQATTLTIAGTANQITSSAGAQSLAANRTWTLSLPSHVIFPGNFQATNSTTTNATSTNMDITGLLTFNGVTASTWAAFCTTITGGSGLCDGTDATGAGGSAAVATSTNEVANQVAVFTSNSGTPALIGGDSDFTFSGNKLTATYASTTGITASGTASTTNLVISAIRSALVLTGADGTASGYGGASACSANNFVTTISAVGGTTCGTAAISGVNLGGTLGSLTATNGTLTFSGTYDGSTARTVGLNLASANTWSALTQFSANASTTQISAYTGAYFGATATSTFNNVGDLLVVGSTTLQNFTAKNATTTNATTTNLKISGQLNWGSGTGLVLTTSGVASNFAGSNCSANNYTTSISASGALTCGQVSLTAGVSGILPLANGGTNQSTWSNTNGLIWYDGTRLTNTWSGSQNIVFTTRGLGVGTTTPYATLAASYWYGSTGDTVFALASSTANDGSTGTQLLTVSRQGTLTVGGASNTTIDSSGNTTIGGWFKLPNSTDPTIDAAGKFAINTTAASSSLRYYDGSAEAVINAITSKSLVYASSTLAYIGSFGASGTTTIRIMNNVHPMKLYSFYCKTDTGTAHVDFNDGTNHTIDVNCTSSGVSSGVLSSNNTWTIYEDFKVDIGRNASAPNIITITANLQDTAD